MGGECGGRVNFERGVDEKEWGEYVGWGTV